MFDILLLILAAASGYAGFAVLALTQKQHLEKVTGVRRSNPQTLWRRIAGSILLILCLVVTLVRDGAAFGSLLAVFLLAATGIAVAFTLAWQPAALRRISLLTATGSEKTAKKTNENF